MNLSPDVIKKILQMLVVTRPTEIGCDECFDELSKFAEQKLAGKSPEKAMPLIHEHLIKCKDCREEYEALLGAVYELL